MPIKYDVDNVPEKYSLRGKQVCSLLNDADEEQSPNKLLEEMKEAVLSGAEQTISEREGNKPSQREGKRNNLGYLRGHLIWLIRDRKTKQSNQRAGSDFEESLRTGMTAERTHAKLKPSARSDVIKDDNDVTLTVQRAVISRPDRRNTVLSFMSKKNQVTH